MAVIATDHPLFFDIGKIFMQAQTSVANHNKNKVKLYAIHEKAYNAGTDSDDPYIKQIDLGAFHNAFRIHLVTVLRTKKGLVVGDNAIKFVSEYMEYIRLRESEEEEEATLPDEDDRDSFQYSFTKTIVKLLCKAATAEDKNIRFRTAQLFAHATSALGSIYHELYNLIRTCLMERLVDREVIVRAQAVIALSKVITIESQDKDYKLPNGQCDYLTTMSGIAVSDPSPDVRREALIALPVTKKSIPFILKMTRDLSTNIRKAVYASVLQPNATNAAGEPNEYHPTKLTPRQRATIVTHGAKDREESVRKAAGKLLDKWLECLSVKDKGEEKGREASIEGIITLLGLLNCPTEPAELALKLIFEARGDPFIGMIFDEQFWVSVKTEKSKYKIFMARVLVDYCTEKKKNARIDENIPTMTECADTTKDVYGSYAKIFEDMQLNQETKEKQRVLHDIEVTLVEMLKFMCSLKDFGDEIGNRALRAVIMDMLPNKDIPDSLIEPVCALLRYVTPDVEEKDLVRDIVDIVAEIRLKSPKPVIKTEPIDSTIIEKLPKSAILGEQRCLNITNNILKSMERELVDDTQLKQEVVTKICRPAITSTDATLRIQGYLCLGYCCLLSRQLALFHLREFIRIITSSGKPELCRTATKIFFDILFLHGRELIELEDNEKNITKFILTLMKEQDTHIRTIAGQGLTKLVLLGLLTQDALLVELVMVYVAAPNEHNNAFKQWLSQFFAIFSTASSRNKRRLCDVFFESLNSLYELRQDKRNASELIKPSDFASLFINWTAPNEDDKGKYFSEPSQQDKGVQFDFANAIVRELYKEDLPKSDKKKVLCYMLNKLYIPDDIDLYKLKVHKVLMDNLEKRRPLRDTKAERDFHKFAKEINTKFKGQLEPMTDEEMRKMEELHELFLFVDDITNDQDENTGRVDKGVKRERSEDSLFSNDSSVAPTPKGFKRRRASEIVEGTEPERGSSTSSNSNPAGLAPHTPQRSPISTYDNPIIISDTEDEETVTPIPKKKTAAVPQQRKSPPPLPPPDSDDEIEFPFDSLIDGSEDEEIQVTDFLAGSEAE